MKSMVFTFGRMNPPTKGHERLISKVVETARALNADHVVYLSQTHKAPTDPLDWNYKRRVCEAAFRGVNISSDIKIRNPYLALENLAKEYDNLVLVAGSDQVDEFTKRFTPYTELWETQFSVVSAGQRIVESNDVDGMSATKMRQFAIDNDKVKFYNGLPSTLSESIKRSVFANVKKGLK